MDFAEIWKIRVNIQYLTWSVIGSLVYLDNDETAAEIKPTCCFGIIVEVFSHPKWTVR